MVFHQAQENVSPVDELLNESLKYRALKRRDRPFQQLVQAPGEAL